MDRDVVNVLHYAFHTSPIDWGYVRGFLNCQTDTPPDVHPFLTQGEDTIPAPLMRFIKEADGQLQTLPKPNWVFGFPLSDKPRQQAGGRSAFVAFPFKLPKLEDVKKAIANAGKTHGFLCEVPDEAQAPGSIVDYIWQQIRGAEVVVTDLTGANPNVMYELALAHALGKEVIAIAQDDTPLPFDVTTLRRTTYDLQDLDALETALRAAFGDVAARYAFDTGDFRY